jgi:hypothetical protein
MNVLEASLFFSFAFMPWVVLPWYLLAKYYSPLAMPGFLSLLGPIGYWIYLDGLDELGILAFFFVLPGWSAGVEMLLNDYFGFSFVELLGIKQCPCENSAWRGIMWIFFGAVVGLPGWVLVSSIKDRSV